ncbi:MAG: iron-containing redox enzyme family protein [Solirubrobacteraceae bacterium]
MNPALAPLLAPPPELEEPTGPRLPPAVGPLTERLFGVLAGTQAVDGLARAVAPGTSALLGDDDFQLALYSLYELHYRGFAGVEEEWEWDPPLLAFRRRLEQGFEAALREAVPRPEPVDPRDTDLALRAILDADEGPPLSRYIEARATLEEFVEFVVHRSAYQLKEADPHSWVIPRLWGAPKAALIRIQTDEYGEGIPDRVHSELFRRTMVELGLDGRYGAYLACLPGVTLASVNLMSLFGLHRRWRGAIVGHLAAFEMSSSLPNRRYSRGLERLGGGPRARAFYDEHVLADAVHENLAAVDLAAGLGRLEPAVAGDVLFGAAALVELDRRASRHLLGAWARGESSLRAPLA